MEVSQALNWAWNAAPWAFLGLALAPVVLPRARGTERTRVTEVLEGIGIFLAIYYAVRQFLAPRLFEGELAFADSFAGTLAVADFVLAAWQAWAQRKQRR